MARNKIAGLVLASALLVGANTAHAHKHATSTQNKQTTKATKNEVLLANANHKMVTNAMVVNGNGNLVLRSQGNKNGKIVSNLSVGEMLKIQSYSQNWYKVTVQETGSTGYISADNLRLIESGVNATPVKMNNNGQVINVSSSLNVRENATMSSSVISSLSNGNQVKVIAKQGEWYKINVNGTIGYVYGEYLNIGSAISTTSNQTVNTNKTTTVKKEVTNTNKTSEVKETKNATTTKVEAKKDTNNSKDTKKQLTPAQLAALQSASFAAIPNKVQAQANNANTQSQVPQIGSATLTLINATSEQVLSNVNVTINGNSFTTNQQGKVKISSIPTGVHTFTVSANNYDSTSVKVNVKAGKSMNSIVSLSPAQTQSEQSSNNQGSNNQGSSNQSSSNQSSSNQSSNNQGSSNQGSSNQGSSNQGSSNQGSSNQGSSNQGSSNQGSSNQGSSNQGSSNQSSSNQGSNSGLSTSQLQQAIVQYAEQFIGTPYVWGATGPNAFDCSGLTSYVYKHFGYYIGRTTYTQIDAGTPVSTNVNSLQPGDLIFWGDPQAPYHVAIYIGNGQYIQAPKPGETVDISSWHLSDISAARRIV